jgi:hypothetical protein
MRTARAGDLAIERGGPRASPVVEYSAGDERAPWISPKELSALNLDMDKFHGDWNYVIHPRTSPPQKPT